MKQSEELKQMKMAYLKAFHGTDKDCHTNGLLAVKESAKSAMKVYLAGAIFGKTDSECKDWRDKATDMLPFETVNPLRRDYRGREGDNYRQIVQGDLGDIRRCDAMLVNAESPSWGTAMEVFHAAKNGEIPVFAFNVDPANCSPWLKYYCEVYRSLEEAIAALIKRLSELEKTIFAD